MFIFRGNFAISAASLRLFSQKLSDSESAVTLSIMNRLKTVWLFHSDSITLQMYSANSRSVLNCKNLSYSSNFWTNTTARIEKEGEGLAEFYSTKIDQLWRWQCLLRQNFHLFFYHCTGNIKRRSLNSHLKNFNVLKTAIFWYLFSNCQSSLDLHC